MKAETYHRKAEELREKAANMNPRFWRKIEELEAEADRLEERAAEKEAEEAESEEDDDSWDEEDDTIDWCDDNDDDDDDDDDDELPQISPSYHGWSISVEKDKVHKYVVTAVLENDDGYEIDRFEIYGDEIDEDADIETVVEEEIDCRNEKRAEAEDFIKNYKNEMNLDPDFDDFNDPD